MTKKRHAMNVSVILGISAVLMLFIFVLVDHPWNARRTRLDRSKLLATGSSVAERINFGTISVASAETQQEQARTRWPAKTTRRSRLPERLRGRHPPDCRCRRIPRVVTPPADLPRAGHWRCTIDDKAVGAAHARGRHTL
jgi:hypothetical protein